MGRPLHQTIIYIFPAHRVSVPPYYTCPLIATRHVQDEVYCSSPKHAQHPSTRRIFNFGEKNVIVVVLHIQPNKRDTLHNHKSGAVVADTPASETETPGSRAAPRTYTMSCTHVHIHTHTHTRHACIHARTCSHSNTHNPKNTSTKN